MKKAKKEIFGLSQVANELVQLSSVEQNIEKIEIFKTGLFGEHKFFVIIEFTE